MTAAILLAAGAVLNSAAVACWLGRHLRRDVPWPDDNALWALGMGLWAVWAAAEHWYWLAPAYAVMAVLSAWSWWDDRRKRRRAARALGEKSRALVAALVQRAREAARPRPVLKPQREAS